MSKLPCAVLTVLLASELRAAEPLLFKGTFRAHCAGSQDCRFSTPETFPLYPNSQVITWVTGTQQVGISPTVVEGGTLRASEFLMDHPSTPVETTFKTTATVGVGNEGGGEPFAVELELRTINFAGGDIPPGHTCSKKASQGGIAKNTSATLTVELRCTWTDMGLYLAREDGSIGFIKNRAIIKVTDKNGQETIRTLTSAVFETSVLYNWEPIVTNAPKVTAIGPKVASNSDGGTVTAKITGSNFVQGAKVSLGDVQVLATRFLSPTELEVDLAGFRGLPEGARDVTVTNPDGIPAGGREPLAGASGTGPGLFYISNLAIEGIQVNQGLPLPCTRDLPCLSHHRTVVRVALSCNQQGCEQTKQGVRGYLHVTRGGSPIPGSPFEPDPGPDTANPFLNVLRTGTVAHNGVRVVAGDRLNYTFAGEQLIPEGTYEISFEANPRLPQTYPARGPKPDSASSLVLTRSAQVFSETRSASQLRFAVLVSADTKADLAQSLAAFDYLKATYPVSESLVSVEYGGVLEQGFTDHRTLKRIQGWLDGHASRGGQPFTHGVLFSRSFADRGFSSCDVTAPQPFCWAHSAIVRSDDHREAALAHEMGHHHLLGDTYRKEGDAGSYSIKNPLLTECIFLGNGCPVQDQFMDTLTRTVSFGYNELTTRSGSVKRDFMGNAGRGERWIDERTWAYLWTDFFAPTNRRPAPLAAVDALVISGFVQAGGTASFSPFVKTTAVPTGGELPEGEYAVELLDGGGNLLQRRSFPVSFQRMHSDTPSEEAVFSLTLARPAGLRTIRLTKGGATLATRAVSTNPPSVSIDAPAGGESLSGTVQVRWRGSDPDGDALTYTVLYSTDGTSWKPIGLELTEPSFAWSTAEYPGGSTARLMVVASDGVNEGTATTAPFRLATKAPLVFLKSPAAEAVFLSGTPVTLEGSAFDLEDGPLTGSALSFTSSRDGALGTGPRLMKSGLSAGRHTITLTARDREGSTATASVAVSVVARPTSAPDQTSFVPIVLVSPGVNASFFTSELTLTNRGTTDVTVELVYTSAFGGGSGSALDVLPAGRQKIVPDAIEYLTSLGLPIPPDGSRGGTVQVRFYGLSSPSAGSATVRTTTAVLEGRAGLSYPAVPPALLTGTVYICGLRQTDSDRSNVAVTNAGSATDGNVVLRLTVFSGDPGSPASTTLPDVALPPGGFAQFSGILASSGLSLTNGYVRVERVSGTAPFYAYGVINDQANSDGSFVPPLVAASLTGKRGVSLPVAVEAGPFTTELVLTNFGPAPKTVTLTFAADAIQAASSEAVVALTLAPGEQRVIPSFVAFLRAQGAAGIGPAGTTYAGAVFLTVASGDVSGLFLGARTSAPGGGGRYGLFYAGVPYGAAAVTSAWLFGLQQDDENRSNLAIVNTGEVDGSPSSFRVELFDGRTGALAAVVDGITVGARRWTQLSAILLQRAPGVTNAYARVTRASGTNPFLCYAVVNDGGAPGVRSDDGAFVAMDLAGDAPPPAPAIEVSSADLDFGSVNVGQSKDLAVTVRNAGTAPLAVSGASSSLPAFSFQGALPFTLGAGETRGASLRFAPAAAGAQSGTITLSSNDPARPALALAVRGQGVAAPPATVSQELAADDGTVENGSLSDGLIIVNRLTPPRYPARLDTVRLFFAQFQNVPSPVGAQVRLVIATDPSGSGTPPVPVQFTAKVTIPPLPVGGAFVDYAIAGGPTIASGDFYVGFEAPTPAGGVVFAADTNGPPRQRGFFSTNGGAVFQGPLVLIIGGVETPANIMLRAVVSVPAP